MLDPPRSPSAPVAVQHPGLVGPDQLRAVLHRHLDTLAAPTP
ncbi:hypothetical protein ACFZDG_04645 [Kitasatospora xanthocidica]